MSEIKACRTLDFARPKPSKASRTLSFLYARLASARCDRNFRASSDLATAFVAFAELVSKKARRDLLGVLLEEVLTWVRGLSGSKRLRALVVFDEVYGFLPPHPASPPTKRPLVALMKQARAFGVGVIVATQNPMDLDYRALGNAGMWCVGRLQTDADRARVIEGLCGAERAGTALSASSLSDMTKRLAPRWFVMRDVHAQTGAVLLQPRWAMSFMHGPMTSTEIRRARLERSNGSP